MARGWRTVILGVLFVASTGCLEARRPFQTAPGGPALTRCRPQDDSARTLIQAAVRRSTSVQALAEKIERSDVIVFVIVSNEPGEWRGDTRLTSEPGKPRMLAVTVSGALSSAERIAVLAHELQHVVEVTAAPEVIDNAAMQRLFKEIGYEVSPASNRFETHAAQEIEQRVRQELTRSRRGQ